MILDDVISTAVNPALMLLPRAMNSERSIVMLLAIGLQESRFEHTHQIGGPAHSWWQFEKGGGVRGVMRHPASLAHAKALCAARGVEFEEAALFDAMEHDQVLACGMARLLLWTDPKPLPKIGDVESAWALYLRVWRPGKPHPETWPKLYEKSVAAALNQSKAA